MLSKSKTFENIGSVHNVLAAVGRVADIQALYYQREHV